ncbi:uncharacterized protein LOC107785472 [Nicotiana tabacum]|uniref:Uncharacterized protein LOC107785472 n=2 Tax=Nicotiana TaxID=4085 RepID=A0A1S3ZCU8_TOBAC|nr:PREDICTED: uncharacterized protein LOC104219532 [Nicotiana sylvestris]XP_016462275.1 PREDICTED: uncharacterized protein LOC107785472 [Nicotiana tabacum]
MESFNFKNIKAEKANAILRYKRLQRITTLFRAMEICIFFVIISRFSTQLTFVSKLFAEYFRELPLALISPGFVFVLGNVIVIVLFLKSRESYAKDNSSTSTITDFHDEYMKECAKHITNYSEQSISNCREQSLKQGKQSINNYREQSVKQCILGEREVGRKIRKSRSENLLCVPQHEETRRELRRSATVVCRRNVDDEMSSEDFRRTVEDFIARQQRLLREEEEFSAGVSCDA